MITYLDFLRICRDAVRLFPVVDAQRPCLQLQTFRVLSFQRGAELGTENLGAVPTDKDTPFFWSRAWHEAKYSPNALSFNWPALTVFEIFNETKSSPFGNGFTRAYRLEISVLDVYRSDCVDGSKTGCQARPINQIYLDTERLLDGFFAYLGKVVVASTSAKPTPAVYYEPWLKAQILAGAITDYAVKYRLDNTLATENKTVGYSRVELPAQNIFGTKTQIVLKVSECPSVEYKTSLPEFGVLPFEAGCLDCG